MFTAFFDSLPAISLNNDSNISVFVKSVSHCVEEEQGRGEEEEEDDDDNNRFPFKLVWIWRFKVAAFSITSRYWATWVSFTKWTTQSSCSYVQIRFQYHQHNSGYGLEFRGFGNRSWIAQLINQQQSEQATRNGNLTETKYIILRMKKIFRNHSLKIRNRVY